MVQCAVQRAVRWLVYAVTLGVVVGLGELHAHLIGRLSLPQRDSVVPGTPSTWCLLGLAAYSVGLPGPPEIGSRGLGVGVARRCGGRRRFSLIVQLIVGTGSAPPLCDFRRGRDPGPSVLDARHRERAHTQPRRGERPRACVARHDQLETLRAGPDPRPEKPAVAGRVPRPIRPRSRRRELAGQIADSSGLRAKRPSSCSTVKRRHSESVVAQAAFLHGERTRVRTLSLFYEEWFGKLPLRRARAHVADVRHPGAPRRRLLEGEAFLRRGPRAHRDRPSRRRASRSWRARPDRQPRVDPLQAAAGRSGRVRVHDHQVPDDAVSQEQVVDRARRPPRRARGPLAQAHRTSTSCRRS